MNEKITKAIRWAEGNPGATSFLMSLFHPETPLVLTEAIVPVLEKATSIRGTNLYVLWSDLCERDLTKVRDLCIKCPIEVLEDACNRQDYSGIKLVKQYLN